MHALAEGVNICCLELPITLEVANDGTSIRSRTRWAHSSDLSDLSVHGRTAGRRWEGLGAPESGS